MPVPRSTRRLKGPSPERLVHRRLDVFLGYMQRADLVPLAGMRLEVGLSRFGTRFLHGGCARAVAGERQIGLVEALDDGLGERGLGAGIGKPEEHPRALAEALDEPGLGHELQMPADARLALAEDLGQVLDVQLTAGQQRQNAQARGLAGAAQGGKRLDAGQAWARGLGSLDARHKDMFIRVLEDLQGRRPLGAPIFPRNGAPRAASMHKSMRTL